MTRGWCATRSSRSLRDLDAEDPTDLAAREHEIAFIKLDGDIGCMVNGAGLAMTTMDLVKRAGGEPANFLDIGGGAKADKVSAAMRLILHEPNVRAILVNIFGGITRGDEVARGPDRGACAAGARRADGRAHRGHECGGGRGAAARGELRDRPLARRGGRQGGRGSARDGRVSILIDRSSRVVVHGLTGREGSFHGAAMQAYGTQIVAGLTPGKGGQTALEGTVPVFDTVVDAVRETGADTSCIFVPRPARRTPSSRPSRPGSAPSSASPRASRRST